jgi:hypothetical protein
MAILNSAMQALVDNLQNSIFDADPLNQPTPEQQTLIASAIKKLSLYTNWEKALGAVAQAHLDSSEQILNQSQASVTTALTAAQGDVEQAGEFLRQQNAHLALLPELGNKAQTALDDLAKAKQAVLEDHMASTVRPVVGLTSLDTPTGIWADGFRSDSVFAVYDSSGESWLVRPSVGNNDGIDEEVNRQDFIKIPADGSGKTVIASHFVRNTGFYPDPTTQHSTYGSSAILPLGTSIDHDDIAYEVVYSAQKEDGAEPESYGGIYCRSSGYSTITKPKRYIYAYDQWGINSLSSYDYYHAAVFYDNNKHCLLLLDDATNLLVEKYRDGNIITTTEISGAAALQAYVDAGDFTAVTMIVNQLPWTWGNRRFSGEHNGIHLSWHADTYGFFGKVGNDIRLVPYVHNPHYRFTEDKRLEPLNYFFTSSVNHTPDDNDTDGVTGDLKVAITDMSGKTLGVYHHQAKSDSPGIHLEYFANALMCMNPYSHIGVLNGRQIHGTSGWIYGVARTCKAF